MSMMCTVSTGLEGKGAVIVGDEKKAEMEMLVEKKAEKKKREKKTEKEKAKKEETEREGEDREGVDDVETKDRENESRRSLPRIKEVAAQPSRESETRAEKQRLAGEAEGLEAENEHDGRTNGHSPLG